MGGLMEELWLFLPAKIKEKALLVIIISLLLFFLVFLLGYYAGAVYGMETAIFRCDELLKNCIIIK